MLDLKFTMRSLYYLEDEYDISVMDLNVEDLGFKEIVHVVWAGTRHHENPPTVDELLDRLDIKQMDKLAEELVDALEEAFPKQEEPKKN